MYRALFGLLCVELDIIRVHGGAENPFKVVQSVISIQKRNILK